MVLAKLSTMVFKPSRVQHKESIHEGIISLKYPCKICNYKSTTKSSLTVHIKSYTCTICKSTFSFKSNLTQHIKSIHDGYRYKCDICTFSASQQVGLYQYILSQFTLETKLVANYVILLHQGRNFYPGMSKTFMMQILSSNQTYIAKNATIKQIANIP